MTPPLCSKCKARLNPGAGQPVCYSACSPPNYLVIRCHCCGMAVRLPYAAETAEARRGSRNGHDAGAAIPAGA